MATELKQVRQRTSRHRTTGSRRPPRAPHAAAAAPNRRLTQQGPDTPGAPARDSAFPAPDERRIDGLGPLWVFLVATLAVVGVVVVAGAVDSWWILVPGMCVYFAATFGALASIMRMLEDDGSTL